MKDIYDGDLANLDMSENRFVEWSTGWISTRQKQMLCFVSRYARFEII
jgi:hypothetical protein